MTTIATDGKTVAADTLLVRGNIRELHGGSKIVAANGVVYAMAGTVAFFAPLIAWHATWEGGVPQGELPKPLLEENDWTFWVVSREGITEVNGTSPFPLTLSFPNAMGTGREIALGTLLAGGSPKEAVRNASRLDVLTGAEVEVLPIPAGRSAGSMAAAE